MLGFIRDYIVRGQKACLIAALGLQGVGGWGLPVGYSGQLPRDPSTKIPTAMLGKQVEAFIYRDEHNIQIQAIHTEIIS